MPSVMHKKSVEGFGISFIEAASYGVASIGGKVGGQADAIDDGRLSRRSVTKQLS